MKPMLKGPGARRLKLNCDKLLSSLAFKSNLRRYISVLGVMDGWVQSLSYNITHKVGDLGKAVQVDPMKPMMKAPGTTCLTP